MSPTETLGDALAFVAGQRGISVEHAEADVTAILARLAELGFAVVPMPDLARGRLSPVELRDRREALGLTVKALAREAGLSDARVRSAERPGSRAHRATVDALAATLDRLAMSS